eukprot:9791176-Ditylum_brightwellii.AAC.1
MTSGPHMYVMQGRTSLVDGIILAYRVCGNTLDQAGPQTCWKQQWRCLRKKGYTNPDPRKIFFKDFNKFVAQRIEKDEELIIGIDTNEVDAPGSDLQKFCTEHNL